MCVCVGVGVGVCGHVETHLSAPARMMIIMSTLSPFTMVHLTHATADSVSEAPIGSQERPTRYAPHCGARRSQISGGDKDVTLCKRAARGYSLQHNAALSSPRVARWDQLGTPLCKSPQPKVFNVRQCLLPTSTLFSRLPLCASDFHSVLPTSTLFSHGL